MSIDGGSVSSVNFLAVSLATISQRVSIKVLTGSVTFGYLSGVMHGQSGPPLPSPITGTHAEQGVAFRNNGFVSASMPGALGIYDMGEKAKARGCGILGCGVGVRIPTSHPGMVCC